MDRHLPPLIDYIPQLSPKYLPPRHLAEMLAILQDYQEKPFQLCVSCPPRFAKTESVLHFVSYVLEQNPDWTLGYLTYAADLATTKSAKARALAEGVGLELASRKVSHWQTPQGGGLIAGGAGGPLTGKGLNIAIVDDPYKNRVEAESPRRRQVIWEWFEDVVQTRIEPGGSTIVFHTRWHEADLIAELVKQKGWRHINLPALSEDEHEASLWPERWSSEALKKKREDVGPFTWASLYQGRPKPRGDRVFNDAHSYPVGTPLMGARYAIGIDLAYSEKTTADYSTIVVMARQGEKFFLVHVERHQVKPPVFMARLSEVAARFPTAPIRFYGSGPELASVAFFDAAMKKQHRRIQARPAVADKLVRSTPFSAAWSRGDVLVPVTNEDRDLPEPAWLDEYLAELGAFTGVGDAHDDQVDGSASAFDVLARGAGEASDGDDSADVSIPRRM